MIYNLKNVPVISFGKQTTLRVLVPLVKAYVEFSGIFQVDDYCLFDVKFYNNRTMLKRTIASFRDSNGYKIITIDSVNLKD